MIGAIAGDIIGSRYEFDNIKTKDFELFHSDSRITDDTVLTVATMDSLINDIPFGESYKSWFRKYPDLGFGGMMYEWGMSDNKLPYNSYGNGSAMRISPVGWYGNSLEEVLELAERSAEVTHNHPEGIKGAQAIASCIFLARNSVSMQEIKQYVINAFGYKLHKSLGWIRHSYSFNETCQGSVPQAITCFLTSSGYVDTIRNAISIGGDSDTIACMAGGIAEAYYGNIPDYVNTKVKSLLPVEMKEIVELFYEKLKNGGMNDAKYV